MKVTLSALLARVCEQQKYTPNTTLPVKRPLLMRVHIFMWLGDLLIVTDWS